MRPHTLRLTAPALAAVLLVSCGGGEAPPAAEPTPEPMADAPLEASLKLYVFDCGRIRFESLVGFGVEDDETDVREAVVPCYVVDHPEGRMLWEGGLPSAMAEADDWQDGARLDATLADQLATLDLGFDLSSMDYVAFSHMHFDHTGVANEVEGATWLVQEAEFEAMFADPVTVPATQPELYSNLQDTERMLLDGDHDVFGDGRVRLLSSPGHTPGHQSLFLDLAETGPLVLSGDLYHLRISREDRRVPVFNTDADQSLASMDTVEAFVAETGATFWIEHDLALFETLDTAPAYYE